MSRSQAKLARRAQCLRARNQRLLGELSGASGRPAEPDRPSGPLLVGGSRRGAFGAGAAATLKGRRPS